LAGFVKTQDLPLYNFAIIPPAAARKGKKPALSKVRALSFLDKNISINRVEHEAKKEPTYSEYVGTGEKRAAGSCHFGFNYIRGIARTQYGARLDRRLSDKAHQTRRRGVLHIFQWGE
jgi:hypothetical protein